MRHCFVPQRNDLTRAQIVTARNLPATRLIPANAMLSEYAPAIEQARYPPASRTAHEGPSAARDQTLVRARYRARCCPGRRQRFNAYAAVLMLDV